MAKKFLLALCMVLCVASAGWCIDPYAVNPDGFGPKIKGLQLGMKRQPWEYLSWGINNFGLPFTMKFTEYSYSLASYIKIKITGEIVEQQHKEYDFKYEILGISGKFKELESQNLPLYDLLTKIEEIAPIEELLFYTVHTGDLLADIYFQENGRIKQLTFPSRAFGAESLTGREFAQAIIDNYHIGGMDGIKNGWERREVSQGWQIKIEQLYNPYGSYVISPFYLYLLPIITKSSFN